MRVFLTGASGFVGSAVVSELLRAGHEVLGLARSEASAESLKKAGAEVHRGSLDDPESLATGAKNVDGVIHTAFIHDFSNWVANCETDRRAIETIGSVLAGSGKPFVITSGTALLKSGKEGTEKDLADDGPAVSPRAPSETAAFALAGKGIRVSLLRLPPSVHDDGDHGFIPMLIGVAKQKGLSAYVAQGSNRWPAVHRLDAANLFRLALEKGTAGSSYHAIGDEAVPFRDIAAAIGKGLDLPVKSKSPEEVPAHFGFIGHFAALDCPATAKITRQELGWHPTHKGLLSDLEEGTYFNL